MTKSLLTFFAESLFYYGRARPLSPPSNEAPSVEWFDDYFTVQHLDKETIAIGEPRYHQQNYSYVIIGNDRAVLFDTGPGVKDIRRVVSSLTDLPVMVTQSHVHYDHVGNHDMFGTVAVPDLPFFRTRETGGKITLNRKDHLGYVEGIPRPEFVVSQWLRIAEDIDLGGRALTVLHAPGHSEDSIVLFDQTNGFAFVGDFIVPGANAAFIPGVDLNSHVASCKELLRLFPSNVKLMSGHRDPASALLGAPCMTYSDLSDLHDGLAGIVSGRLKGKGWPIKRFQINERMLMYK